MAESFPSERPIDPDNLPVKVATRVMVEKFDGDPAPGDEPVEVVVVEDDGTISDVWHPGDDRPRPTIEEQP